MPTHKVRYAHRVSSGAAASLRRTSGRAHVSCQYSTFIAIIFLGELALIAAAEDANHQSTHTGAQALVARSSSQVSADTERECEPSPIIHLRD